MVITVLGNCCTHCSQLHTNTLQAVKELNLHVEVNQEEDMLKMLQYGIMRTPALLINDEVISEGDVLPVDKLKEIFKKFATI